MSRAFRKLSVAGPEALVFGSAPRPVPCGRGLTIGAGVVFPEVNFTLPAIEVNSSNWPAIVAQYQEMAATMVKRAVALEAPGLVLEFELLPAMTENPEWGGAITAILRDHLRDAHEKHGLASALRATPVDIRDPGGDGMDPENPKWHKLKRSFELCIEQGADIVSIESTGGKEIHDKALMHGDIRGIVFALAVASPRDMVWLWREIVGICDRVEGRLGRVVPGGDSACGFANTAMQLAHQRMLPQTLAAVVRAMSAVRALAAYECGAFGPSKDCAYEGPVLKAIAGCPISMEGKSASCAHFSYIGNIASAMCDLWSNESVQNVRLLSGSAPEASTESLIYDCRLMNAASAKGQTLMLRDLLSQSDEWLSPQAAVLSPEATFRIARVIVDAEDDYRATVAAGLEAVNIIHEGLDGGKLKLSRRELAWLDRIGRELGELPENEERFIREFGVEYSSDATPASV